MTTTALTKTPTTYHGIRPGDILDGELVIGTTTVTIDDVRHVGLQYPGGIFGELTPASQPVSVYR